MNILAKTINSKVISLPIITYPVRLSDVIRNYVHFCSVVCLKALTSGPGRTYDLVLECQGLDLGTYDLVLGLECPVLGLYVQILSLTTLLEF